MTASPTKGSSFLSVSSDPLEKILRVADVMTSKLMTLTPTQSFADAVSLMANNHFHHCLIADVSGRLVGVLSDRDILRAVSRTKNWQTKCLNEIMTPNPFTVKAGTLLIDAAARMAAESINCLPVVTDDGSVFGILTSTDLVKSFQNVLELLRKRAGANYVG